MNLRAIFNQRVVGPPPVPAAQDPGGLKPLDLPSTPATPTGAREGVFVSPQSLASFPGASLAVATLWGTAGALNKDWGHNPAVGLAISLLVGLMVYLVHATDPQRPQVTTQQRIVEVFIALVNALTLFTAALGIAQVVPGTPAP